MRALSDTENCGSYGNDDAGGIANYNYDAAANLFTLKLLGVASPMSTTRRASSGFGYDLRFPSPYFDSETGKHYNYFRDYDPSIGRYIERDPLGLRAGLNGYLYVGAAALRYSDKKGLAADCHQGPTDDECCKHPVSQKSMAGLGGTVMCCHGRKVSCAAPFSGPEPGYSIIKKCILAHEDRHHQDVECPYSNTIELANFKNDVTTDAGECAAFGVGLTCLRNSTSHCGTNNQCTDWVSKNISDLIDKGNSRHKCGFLP